MLKLLKKLFEFISTATVIEEANLVNNYKWNHIHYIGTKQNAL